MRNVYDLENSDYILGKIYFLPYFQEALKCQYKLGLPCENTRFLETKGVP